jgi:hypothetical protein
MLPKIENPSSSCSEYVNKGDLLQRQLRLVVRLLATPDLLQTCFAEGNEINTFLTDQIREYDQRSDASKFKRPAEDLLFRQPQG